MWCPNIDILLINIISIKYDKIILLVHPLWNIQGDGWDNTVLCDAYEKIVEDGDYNLSETPIFFADTFNLARRPGKVYHDFIQSLS